MKLVIIINNNNIFNECRVGVQGVSQLRRNYPDDLLPNLPSSKIVPISPSPSHQEQRYP